MVSRIHPPEKSPKFVMVALGARTMTPAAWLWVMIALIGVLIVTKSIQVYIEAGAAFSFFSVFSAMRNGILRRLDDVSFFVALCACAAIYCYSFAAALYTRHPNRTRALELAPAQLRWWLGLVATGWTLYLIAAATAEDPGTFFTNQVGLIKFVQVVEGLTNLVLFALAYFWIVIAVTIVNGIRSTPDTERQFFNARQDRIAMGLTIAAALLPFALYSLMSLVLGSATIRQGWEQGNDYAGAFGFTIFLLVVFAYPALKALAVSGLAVAALVVPLIQIIFKPHFEWPDLKQVVYIPGGTYVDNRKIQMAGGHMIGSFGIDSHIKNVRTVVHAMPESPLKSEFERLEAQVMEAIEVLRGQGKEAEAERAAKHLMRMAEDADDAQAEPSQWALSKKGLLDAVAAARDLVGPITETVTSILSLLKISA